MSEKRFAGIVFTIASIALIVLLAYTGMSTHYFNNPPSIQLPAEDNSGWIIVGDKEDDQALFRTPAHLGVQLHNAGESVTITKNIIIDNPEQADSSPVAGAAAPMVPPDNVLFFYNYRQGVTVQADGKILYQLGGEGQTTKMSTACWCAVPLPVSHRPYVLSVTFTNLVNDSCMLPEMSFTTANDVLVYFMMTDPLTFLVIPLCVLLGIGLIVLAIFMKRLHILDYRVVCLALFLLCSAGWSFTDMGALCLLPVDPQMMAMLSFCFLMLMPIPMLYFAYLSSNNRRLMLKRFILVFIMMNILVQTIMLVTDFASMNQMLPVSQGLILAMVIYSLVCMILDYRAKPTKVGKAQVAAFAMVMVLSVVSVFAYWVGEGMEYRSIFQFIIMLFLLIMLCVVIYSMLQRNYSTKMRDAELEAYKKLSVLDSLTGLANRRAFDEAVAAVWNETPQGSNAQLVFLDLNGLKYTNDLYGHLAGDELILAASRLISCSFEDIGKVYRIGGDEFAVIIPGLSDVALRGLEELDSQISEYNVQSGMSLSIAHGFSSLVDQLGQKRSVSNWKMDADKNMYRNKIQSRHIFVRGSEEDYREVISSFASAVDAKDSYTADHSGRVGVMSDLICLMLGMSETSLSQIHTAASLHDLGKIGVPDSILGKKGRLSSDEWEVMRSHPAIGENIVKHTKAFYEVSQIIRHHHERYDGSGYPDGLAGNDIPIGARIIAIADSIDAMTSDRSYRDAMPLDYCRQEIERGLGTNYDPAIGSIVLEHWEEIEEVVLANPKETQTLI